MSRNGASSTGRMGGCRRAKEFLRGVISHPLFVQGSLAIAPELPEKSVAFYWKGFSSAASLYISTSSYHFDSEAIFMSKNQSAAVAQTRTHSLKNVRTLVVSAVLAAISVVLARLIIPMPDVSTRFSLEAVPIFLAGMFFGPIPGALVGFSADLVGCLFSGYGYNPLFFYACFFCASANIRAISVPDSCIPRFIHSCTQPYSI